MLRFNYMLWDLVYTFVIQGLGGHTEDTDDEDISD